MAPSEAPPSAKTPQPPYFDDGVEGARRLIAGLAPASCDVALVGDSLAAQWPVELFAPASAINLGNGGDRIENVTWRLRQADHAVVRARLVVLSMGLNNVWSGDDVDLAVATLVAGVAEVRDVWPAARLRLMTLCRFSAQLAYLNDRVDDYNRRVEAQFGAEILDCPGILAGERACFQDDLFHFSREGYSRLTAALLPLLG